MAGATSLCCVPSVRWSYTWCKKDLSWCQWYLYCRIRRGYDAGGSGTWGGVSGITTDGSAVDVDKYADTAGLGVGVVFLSLEEIS